MVVEEISQRTVNGLRSRECGVFYKSMRYHVTLYLRVY
jgi:hypothetical protein